MMKRIFALVIGLVFLFAAQSVARATDYAYTYLDVPGEALDLNSDGVIVGFYDENADKILGFSLTGATLSILEYPGADWTMPYSINNNGIIIGTKLSFICFGFSFDGTAYTAMQPPYAEETLFYDVNDPGTIVGMALNWAGSWGYMGYEGFSYDGTTYTLLRSPEGTFHPCYINNQGTIVGSAGACGRQSPGASGWYAVNADAWTLLDYPGATSTTVWEINNQGTVVGQYTDASGIVHGFSFDGATRKTLDFPGAVETIAYDINDNAVIVGSYTDAAGKNHGFSFDGTSWSTLDYPGATDTFARLVNNNGVIVGSFANDSARGQFVAAPIGTIGIDIRPWSNYNTISRYDWGLLPVAILSASKFDALETMNLDTITFGRTGEEDSMAFCSPWEWDVNRDGYKDLICFFWTHRAEFQCGDTVGILKGLTQGGSPVEGKNEVKVVPCK